MPQRYSKKWGQPPTTVSRASLTREGNRCNPAKPRLRKTAEGWVVAGDVVPCTRFPERGASTC